MRQPVDSITDRAKRYRANSDIPDSPRTCGFCGSKVSLGVDHIDGYEEHGEPENLMWLCKSCNGLKAVVFKAAGVGRATNQYNPFGGLLAKVFDSKQTYHRDVAAERKARQREAREHAAEERREFVAEKKRERYERGKLASRYKGVSIYKRGDGQYYASIDPDSHYESLRDLKRVVDHFRNPASSLSAWEHAVAVLRGEMGGSPRQAARVVRSTPPGRRAQFLDKILSRKNPGAKTLGAFVNALMIAKGDTPGDRSAAQKLLHDTPQARRSEFQREIWSIRKDRYGPSGRQEGLPF
jgi:hypothetical protein